MKRYLILIIIALLAFSGIAYAQTGKVDRAGQRVIKVDSGGAIDTNWQDQTSPPLFIEANQVVGQTTLANSVSVGDRDFVVISNTSMEVGQYVGLFNLDANRFYTGYIKIIFGNTVTVDNTFDFAYNAGDTVGFGITNMAVNGSPGSPEIFGLRGADPGIDVTVDITRMFIYCITDTAIDLTDFGDITGGLEYGLLLRRVDGNYQNYVNLKDNIGMKSWMMDWDSLDDTSPGQGLHGFVGRLTFGGVDKMGTVPRIGPGEDLQAVIQDDLSSMPNCGIKWEGHVVVD